ncbi:hypothetical protein EB796_002413 [Bugula neritina]|uniref:F5/8 type C domain-containing protein n=1 Tax=Bugula neritina TaxID=10212 RepID=A0A7J7KM97_BUGNE|nr:hypothetical protein EB796_002413 [Bugula neritina]
MPATCLAGTNTMTTGREYMGRTRDSTCQHLQTYDRFYTKDTSGYWINGLEAQTGCRNFLWHGYDSSHTLTCSSGSNTWHECVGGTPDIPICSSIASGKTASSSSESSGKEADKAFDGDPATYFESGDNEPGWWQVDLHLDYTVHQISWLPVDSDKNFNIGFYVITQTNVYQLCDRFGPVVKNELSVRRHVFCYHQPIGRYVRLTNGISGSEKFSVNEVEVYGELAVETDLDGDNSFREDCNYGFQNAGWSEWTSTAGSCSGTEVCGIGHKVNARETVLPTRSMT